MSFQEAISSFSAQLGLGNIETHNLPAEEEKTLDGVVISGMGGSGLPGTLFEKLAPSLNFGVPVKVWKDYGLPSYQFKNPLFVFISFSGDTEEVVSGLERSLKNSNKNMAVITTKQGGKLKTIAEKNSCPTFFFGGSDLTPRQSLGFMYSGLVNAVNSFFPKAGLKVGSVSADIEKLKQKGKELAEELQNTPVLVYSSSQHAHISYVWKININETAKMPSFTGRYPEVNHNEVMGFNNSDLPFSVVILKDKDSSDWFNRKTRATAKFLEKFNVSTYVLELEGKNLEEKTWNSVVLSYWTSYYLAELKGVDPADTSIVEDIKKA